MITEKTNVWRSGLSSLAKSLARVLPGSGPNNQSGSNGAFLAVFSALATLSLLFTPNTTLAQDNPPAVKQLTVSFDQDSYTAIENGARAMVTVSLDDETDRTVAIPITTSPATGDHFSLSPSTVYFDPGDRSQTIYLTAEDDENTANETVRLSFGTLPTGVSAGTQSSASVTLWDDDLKELTISFGAATYRAREESFDATVAITLDSPSDRALRIPITYSPGADTVAADYDDESATKEVVFEANQSRKTITVSAKRDDDLTNGSVVLSFGTLPALVNTSPESFSTTTVNLEDDGRRLVTFDAAEHTATEGGDATVTVNVTPPPSTPVSIRISVSPPPASSDPDFTVATLTGGALNVDTDGTSTFTVTANEDSDMVSEKITFTIVGPLPATVNYGEHERTVVTLMDNDMPDPEADPTVAFERTTHNAHEGGAAVTVAANLSKASSEKVTVPFTASIAGGTNPDDTDYELSATDFVFAPNQRRATITVTAEADEDITLETLTLTLAGPSGDDPGYTLGGTQDSTIVRLIDDADRTVTIAASGTTLVEGATSTPVDLTVTIAPVPTADVMIPITINPGSGDFTVPSDRRVTVGTSGTGTFTITAKEDDGNTRDQEVTFGLGGLPANFKKGSANSVKVTMLDATRPAVSFGKDRYFAVENGDAAEVELMLSVPSDKDLTVSVTPTGDADAYLLSARRVTFAKGTVGPEKITVVAATDADVALDTVALALGPEVAEFTGDADDLIPGTIVSTTVDLIDDGLRAVSFGATTPAANLNNGVAGTVTVTLSGDALTTGEIAIPITVMSDSEGFTLEGAGFNADTNTLTFDSTNTSPQTITVTAVADEDSKSNDVEFGFGALPVSVRAGSPSTAKVQLQEPGATGEGGDTSVLSFAAASYSAQENGDNMAVVAITLDPARDEKVTVPVTIGGGDSTDTEAFSTTLSGNPGNVVFNAGETRKTITVTAKSDADAANESITLSLDASTVTPANSVTLGGQASTAVNILDDGQAKGTVTFSADESVVEGTSVTVTVTLGAVRTGDLTIPINTEPATGDFILSPPRRVTIPEGQTTQTIILTSSADDMDIEEDMKVTLSFGALPSDLLPGTPATTTVTWTDNDREALTVSFAETSDSVDEGDEVEVTINLDQEADRTVRIPITVGSTSTATKEDYTLSAMEVVFEEGDDEKTITLTAIEDPDASPDETVVLSFGTPPGGVTAGSDLTVTITDTHNPVTIAFGATGYAAIEGGTAAEIPVNLSAETNRELMISIATEPETGPFMLEGMGVTGEQGNYMLAFAKDSQSAMITVRATDDPDALDQMVTLSFDDLPDGVTLAGTQDTAAVTLVDDGVRMPTVSFDKTAYTAMEGDPDDTENPGTPATVMIELDPPLPSGSRETLTIAVSGWPATAPATPDHFKLSDDEVTFGPGEKSKTITVEATPNQTPETLDGTVKLIFGAMPPANVPEGVTIASQEMGGEATVTLVDDDRNDAIVAYFMPGEFTAMEGGEAAMVSVGLDLGEGVEMLDRNITLPITVTHSEGAEGDYMVEPTSVEFSAGTAAAELWAPITVTANLDDDTESETVTLAIGMLSPGVTMGATAEQPSSVTVTLQDDELLALTVSLDMAEYSAMEGGEAATVMVSLSAASDRDITIPVTVTPAEGTEDGYELSAKEVTFAEGEMSAEITVTASHDDDTQDDSITLSLNLEGLAHVTAGDITSATVSLTDDGLVPLMVTFDAATYEAMEGDDAVTVMVNLNRETDRDVTFQINTDPAEGDFDISATEVMFAIGEMSKEITISANLDDDTEDDTVTLSFGELPDRIQEGDNPTATVTLTDDGLVPLKVIFASATYTATEGGDAATVSVILNQRSDREVTIPITMSPEDGPYELSASEVTFAEGESRKQITVTATLDADLDDAMVTLGFGDELPERVTVGEGQPTTVVTLDDDMLLPLTVSFAAAEYTATEGGAAATLMVSLSAASDRELIIPINMDPASGPYEASASQVTFAAGDMNQEITVTATLDDDTENDMVTLSLGELPNRVSEGAITSTAVTLADDGLVPLVVTFDAAEYDAMEGGAAASVWVNLNVASDRDITIPVNANPASGDFEISAMEVSFGAGEMSKEITVTATLDNDTEDDSVTLSLGAMPNRVTGGANTTAVVTLVDDGLVPLTVSFGAAEYTATEGGAAATVMVNLDVASDRDVTIPITTNPAEGDFELSASEVTFAAGDMTMEITVTATSDTDVDDEMVMLGLGALPNRVYSGEPASTMVSLVDEGYTITFAMARQTVRESERGTVTANISPAANGQVSVPLTVTHQGGATAADYSGVPGSLAFSGGSSQASFTVSVMADEENDPGESIDVSFGSLPDKVNAGDLTMTTVEFEQFRTPEQFSRTLQAALAVVAGAMGDSAVNAIETRFERYRENMGKMSSLRRDSETTYGHWSDMESPGMAMTGHQGYTGLDNGFVPMATTTPGTGLTTGSTGYGRSHTSGSYEEAISLGALTSTARPGESVIASGYGMAPSGEQDVNFSGVAFEMAMEHGDEGKFSPVVWVQGDLQRFDGEVEDIGMDFDGGLDAIHLGVDLYANGQTLAGVSLMQSWGDLDYTDDGVDGSLDSSMSTFHPYVYFQANQNLGVWGILGFGSGSVDVSEPDRTHEFDADFSMFAGGVRSVLNRRDNNELGLSADAFMAELSTDAADDITGVSGEAQRARVMVDWLSNRTMEAGQDFSWKAEIGGRFDGGDGIEGAGIEAGFRAGLVDSDQGLDVALGARALLLHENDASDYGIGVQVTWDPGEKRKGMVASLGSSYGQDRGGSTSLWDNGNAMNPIGSMWQETQVRVDGEIGYAGVLTPFGLPGTVMPYSRARFSGYGQEFGVGTRWTPAETSSTESLLPATFELEGLTRETRTGLNDLALVLRMSIPFGGEKAVEPRHSRNRAVNEAAMGPTVSTAPETETTGAE